MASVDVQLFSSSSFPFAASPRRKPTVFFPQQIGMCGACQPSGAVGSDAFQTAAAVQMLSKDRHETAADARPLLSTLCYSRAETVGHLQAR